MKIVLVGGGTGGHITPTLAVARELKAEMPVVENTYILEQGSRFSNLVNDSPAIDHLYKVRAGKFRRYHGQSWLMRALDLRTWLLNLRDIFYTLIGIVQAYKLLGKLKPDLIFIKGGFVGVPVGIAARLRRLPFITHDSDTVPGLANRIIGRWAKLHATGMPPEFYSYPTDKIRYVGIPLGTDFEPITPDLKLNFRKSLGFSGSVKIILVTGGSQGATRLNKPVKVASTQLLNDPSVILIHQTGRHGSELYKDNIEQRLIAVEFLPELYKYSGAADVIVTRAGATSIAEFAVQGKACILVPHPLLTSGHQLKNAARLAEADAAIVLDEAAITKNPELIVQTVESILSNSELKNRLEKNISKIAKANAASELAKLIIKTAHETV